MIPEDIEDKRIELFYIINGDFNKIKNSLKLLDNNIDKIFGNKLNSNIFEVINGLIKFIGTRYGTPNLIPEGCFLFYVPTDYGKPLKIRTFFTVSEKRVMMKSSKYRGNLEIENGKLIIDTLELDSNKYNL